MKTNRRASRGGKLPAEAAGEWHAGLGSGVEFREIIRLHLAGGGLVFSSTRLFAMARPVLLEWGDDRISDPRECAPPPVGDCWHVWLLAGDPAGALELLPYGLPWVSWHRRGKLRVHRWDDVARRFAR